MRILSRIPRLIFWIVTMSIEVVYTIILISAFETGGIVELSRSAGETISTTIRNISLPILALVALQVAVWRSTVAERQADAAQQQVDSSRQSLLNERYQKGAEMLGSEVLSVRLGGIYALGRLALEHPEQYHIPIVLLFCAFVRQPPEPKEDRHSYHDNSDSMTSHIENILKRTPVGEDVTTIIKWIGARKNSQRSIEWQGGVVLSVDGANLRGIKLSDVDLADLNLTNVDLSNSELDNVRLSRACMKHTRMIGARVTDSNLSKANMSDADAGSAQFKYVELTDANLENADMSSALLSGCDLSRATLNEADLSDVTLVLGRDLRVKFCGARLRDAKLHRADFRFSDMSEAYISGADLTATVFSRGGEFAAIGLTQAQLNEAVYDGNSPPQLGNLVEHTERTKFWKEATPLVWNR